MIDEKSPQTSPSREVNDAESTAAAEEPTMSSPHKSEKTPPASPRYSSIAKSLISEEEDEDEDEEGVALGEEPVPVDQLISRNPSLLDEEEFMRSKNDREERKGPEIKTIDGSVRDEDDQMDNDSQSVNIII